jgi:SAM-dependent methyltransferase
VDAKSIVRHYVPHPLIRLGRRIYYWPRDFLDAVLGRRSELTPPRAVSRFVGAGDFESVGETYARYIIELAELKRNEGILDVGCGVGRMAAPLTRYLEAGGFYEGFDVVAEGIEWCREHFTPRFPNFRFRHADLYNKQYNPAGKGVPSEYEFPYGDGAFDVVFLGSVFTHMLRKDTVHYAAEIRRVLKTGGRCFATFFLLNAESRSLAASGKSTLQFQYPLDGCSTIDKRTPERAVAYEEDFIRDLFGKLSMSVVEPIRYGSWSGRGDCLGLQDIAIFEKRS